MLLRFNYWGCLLLGSTFPLNWATYFFLFCLFISCCWLKIRPFSLIWLIDLLQQSSSSTRQIDLCEIFVFTLLTVHRLVYQSLSLPLNQPETVRKMFSLAGQSNQNCLWFGCNETLPYSNYQNADLNVIWMIPNGILTIYRLTENHFHLIHRTVSLPKYVLKVYKQYVPDKGNCQGTDIQYNTCNMQVGKLSTSIPSKR